MSERMEIKVSARGNWVRVSAEVEGADVSHMGFGPQPVRLGSATALSMAGVGGVGTDPPYRRLGLARQVYARMMEEIRKAGYSSVGLYTGTEIVAHRLYRRFGFVDTLIPGVGAKLLDPERYVVRKLSDLLQGEVDPARAEWRCVLRLHITPHAPCFVQIERGKVRLLPSPPPEVDLSLTMSSAACLQLFMNFSRFSIGFAEASKQVQWQGRPEHWELLRGALAARRRVVKNGG